jgi:hypothetical protein
MIPRQSALRMSGPSSSGKNSRSVLLTTQDGSVANELKCWSQSLRGPRCCCQCLALSVR